jgi:hypothetical protein
VLWTLRKGDCIEHAELRTHREAGFELQLLMDGKLFLGQRYPTRARAVEEAEMRRVILEAEGWTEKGRRVMVSDSKTRRRAREQHRAVVTSGRMFSVALSFLSPYGIPAEDTVSLKWGELATAAAPIAIRKLAVGAGMATSRVPKWSERCCLFH